MITTSYSAGGQKVPVTPASPVLEKLSSNYFEGEKLVLGAQGQLSHVPEDFSTFSQRLFGEKPADLIKVSDLFYQKVVNDVRTRLTTGSGNPLRYEEIAQNIDALKGNFRNRAIKAGASQGQVKAIASRFTAASQSVEHLQNEQIKGKYAPFARRVARFALYQAIQSGSVSLAYEAAKGLATEGFSHLYAAGEVALSSDLGKHAVGKAIGGVTFLTGHVPVNLTNILSFVAISEGPGVVGHVVRKTTPKFVKGIYHAITPTPVQRAADFVFHTDKWMETKLDTAGRFLAILMS